MVIIEESSVTSMLCMLKLPAVLPSSARPLYLKGDLIHNPECGNSDGQESDGGSRGCWPTIDALLVLFVVLTLFEAILRQRPSPNNLDMIVRSTKQANLPKASSIESEQE